MTCETSALLIHFARPSELAVEDRTALDSHLAACPACTNLLARHQAEDAAITRAMNAVTVPVGFRDALQNQAISVRNSLWWSKWTSRLAATAATVIACLLGYSGYVHATQQTIDSEVLIDRFESRSPSFDEWRAARDLPPLPDGLNARLVTFTGEQPLGHQQVPAVELRAGPGQVAVIYFVKGPKFNLTNASDAVGSNGSVKVYRNQPHGYTIIVVYTGTTLAPFMHNPADAA